MKRRLLIALAALALAGPAWAGNDGQWTDKPASESVVDSLSTSGKGRSASVRNTTGDLTSDGLKLEGCATALVCVTPDITNNATHDKTAEVIQCPEGSTAATAVGCKSRYIRDVAGAATKDLNGDEAAGKDCAFGLSGPVLFVKWAAIASGTTQADALCEQVD